MSQDQVAMVVGVGGGLGAALGRRFAAAGMKVALAARGDAITGALAEEIQGSAYPVDVTDEAAVEALFDRLRGDLGEPDLVVFNAGAFQRTSVLEASAEDFERCWRVGCLGGFLIGRAARAPSSSPARRRPCAAAPASSTWRSASSACAPWPRAWRANSAPRASMLPI